MVIKHGNHDKTVAQLLPLLSCGLTNLVHD